MIMIINLWTQIEDEQQQSHLSHDERILHVDAQASPASAMFSSEVSPAGSFFPQVYLFSMQALFLFAWLLFFVYYYFWLFIFIFCFFSDDTQFEYDDGIFGSAFTRRGICVARGSIFFNFLQWYFCYFQVASTEPSLSLKDSSTSKAADFLSSILNHASPPGNNVHHAADSPALFAE